MDTRPSRFLKVIINLLVINAVVTEMHYLLILLRIIPVRDGLLRVVEFTIADTLATAVPSFIAAYGLWQLKKWGLVAAMVACGGYLHGMLSLLTRAVATSQFTAMNIVSIYFIVFSLLTIGYLWRQKTV